MITVTNDPTDSAKVILTATVTMFLEKVLIRSLDDEIEKRIRHQAIKDLKSNPDVKKVIAEAATKMLLTKLGVEEKQKVVEENNERTSASASDDGQRSAS